MYVVRENKPLINAKKSSVTSMSVIKQIKRRKKQQQQTEKRTNKKNT